MDNSNVAVRGLDQHFERVDLANRKKKALEERQNKYNGDNWKYKITIPQEFNFQLGNRPQDTSFTSNNHSPIRRNQSVVEKSIDKIEKNVVWVEKGNRSPYLRVEYMIKK